MRVAAVDGAGRAGTTDYELKVEVPRADPLKLSTLVLGTQQQGGGFVPRLDFSNEPVAIGLLEIYGVPKGGTVTVELDVVSTAEGTALATAQTTVSPGKSDDMRIAFGGFSIGSLPRRRLPDARRGEPRRQAGRQGRPHAAQVVGGSPNRHLRRHVGRLRAAPRRSATGRCARRSPP